MKKYIILVFLISGCALMGVRQQDLDSWVGVPVEALDTHSIFLTIPMVRTKTDSGIEIRNYANVKQIGRCTGLGNASVNNGWVNANTFSTCTSQTAGCNNIFYIKDGKVIEYAPTGNCYTNKDAQPQERYLRLKNQ